MSFLYTLFLIFPLLIPPTTPTTPTTTREKHYPICDRKTTGEETKRETERRHRLSPRVDPFVGSGGDGYGVASLSPAAQVPFGMARVGPDSFGRLFSLPWKHIGGYSYCDETIQAFSHIRLVGAGVDDLGNLGIIPLYNISQERVKCGFEERGDMREEREGEREERDGNGDGVYVRKCNYFQKFSHQEEEARPGLYSVRLYDPHLVDSSPSPSPSFEETPPSILCSLSATAHAGIHQYIFETPFSPSLSSSPLSQHVLIDPCHNMAYSPSACKSSHISLSSSGDKAEGQIEFAGDFSGRTGGFNLSFSLSFSPSFSPSLSGTWDGNGTLSYGERETDSVNGGVFVTFERGEIQERVVEVSVGLSFLDLETAEANREKEIGERGFEEVEREAWKMWEEKLSVFQVKEQEKSETVDEDLIKFYTSVYHSYTVPTNYTESDGRYYGFDHRPHFSKDFNFFSDLSNWDIWRTHFPLLVLIEPQVAFDIVKSMEEMAYQSLSQSLPKWAFIGGDTGSMEGLFAVTMITDFLYNSDSSYSESLNLTSLLDLCVSSLRQQEGEDWLQLGYIPNSVSKSLCFAFNDFCVSEIARYAGSSTIQAEFLNTSAAWENLWNSKVEFLCNKDREGDWTECDSFLWVDQAADPRDSHYTEGDAWHYRWFVPHNLTNLIQKMGGNALFTKKLETFFEKSTKDPVNFFPNPFFWAGNEPDLQTPYLFVASNFSHLTEKWVDYVREQKYTIYSNGISGNDDYGTMSAWFLWSSLSLYPDPGLHRYIIGTPLFPYVSVQLPGGELVVEVVGSGGEKMVEEREGEGRGKKKRVCEKIDKVSWNGVVLETRYLDAQEVLNGGVLQLFCGIKFFF